MAWRFGIGSIAAVMIASLWLHASAAATSTMAPARGQLQAGPILLEIGPGSTSTRLRLRNTGSAPVAGQVRVYAWTQENGDERLVPVSDLALSPPIVEIPPGVEQIVRIVNTGAPASGQDRAYRVVVDELPQPAATAGTRVGLRMRYVIPAFVRARDASPPSLECAIEADRTMLACENRGGRAAQLGQSTLVAENGDAQTLSAGLFGYVLPGSRRVWHLATTAPETSADYRLDTLLNGLPATLAVGRRP